MIKKTRFLLKLLFLTASFLIVNAITSKAIDNVGINQFVEDVYRNVLGREADSQGKSYWVNLLKNNKTTGVDVTKAFLYSDEYTYKRKSNEQFLNDLYKSMLEREPDTSGYNYWISHLKNGYTRNYLISKFSESSEFNNLCNSKGINPGRLQLSDVRDTNPEIVNYVSKVYENALGRRPDEAGLIYWSNRLKDNKINTAELIQIFMLGDEIKSKNLSNKEWTSNLYRAMFDRNVDVGGLNWWSSNLDEGVTKKTIIYQMTKSAEFSTVCSKYKVTPSILTLTSLEDMNPDKVIFVNKLYKGFLNRTPDDSGLNYWTNKIVNQGLDATSLINSIVNSQEFTGYNVDNAEYINRLYRGVLLREADQGGLDCWVNNLQRSDRKKVLIAFLNSNEFDNVCKTYSISKGKIVTSKGFKSEKFQNSNQVITVTNSPMGSKYATVNAYENRDGEWNLVYSNVSALIGKNGMVYDSERMQSTMTTPAGIYSMPFAFGINNAPNGTKIQYRKLNGDEYWDLNSGSPTYNRWVTSNPGGDNERLVSQTSQYKYAIVIDYNWNQVPNKGGAIFLHVKPRLYTAGCVGIDESMMINILKWLDPEKNPKILICPQNDLEQYYN